MERVLKDQKEVWKIFVTTIHRDCWMVNEWRTLEEAQQFAKENQRKLNRCEWSIHRVEFGEDGHIVAVDGRRKEDAM